MSFVSVQTERRFDSPMRLESLRSSPSSSTSRYSTPHISRTFDKNATIVLVGSRGSGKRSLGFIGATHLGRRLITEDHYFEEACGVSRKEFLQRYGVKEFHNRNVQIVQKMLHENRTGCIIECGMSSLARATQEALREYSSSHPVIYVIRNPDRVRKLLRLSESEAKRLLQADKIHRGISNFEYYNLHDSSCEQHSGETSQDRASPHYSSGLKDAKQDFSNFLDFIMGIGVIRASFESQFCLAAIPAEHRPYTYDLNIRLSNFIRGQVDLDRLDTAGGDVVELRIDIIVPDMLSVVNKYVSMLRRKLGIPVIFKVENMIWNDTTQGHALLRHALRLGVEYIAVDLQSPDSLFQELIQQKGSTKIIAHFLYTQQFSAGWDDGTMAAMYQRAQWLGIEIVRLLRIATSAQDNYDCRIFSEAFSEPDSTPPGINSPVATQRRPQLIAYNIGTLGYDSMVANKVFTPVTHPAISNESGVQDFFPTAQEAMQGLYQTRTLDSLHFYIYGAAVEYSLSPAMHNAAFRTTGLGHDMRFVQALTLDELHQASQDPNFGGSGIAQPFKVGIMSHLTGKSHHATAIGAVNTLVPLRALPDGTAGFLRKQAGQRNKAGNVVGWYGDNTDWQGIMTTLRRNVSPANVVQASRTTGLVIGSGGMARASIYAMIQLGCRKIFMYNRTIKHAEVVAAHFNSWASTLSETGEIVSIIPSRHDPWPIGYNHPTMIVSCIPTQQVGSQPSPEFDIPTSWLQSSTGGVFLELAYKPRLTPLLAQFARMRLSGQIAQAWVTVDGLEFIPEQGIAQFELMTGRIAPRGVMKREIAERLAEADKGILNSNGNSVHQNDHINRVAENSWGGVDGI